MIAMLQLFIAPLLAALLTLWAAWLALAAESDADLPRALSGQIGAESEWRTANTNSVTQAAADAGITLKFSDAQQKQENQIKAIRSFIAQRVDVFAQLEVQAGKVARKTHVCSSRK